MINYQAFPKPTKVVKVPKRLSPIGKRTKKRLAEHGSESILHDMVWNEQFHYCEICSRNIPDHQRSPACFAHRLGKGMYPKYRYIPDNIALVCSIRCHHELDKIYQGRTEYQINKRNTLIALLDKLIENEKA